ncbi:MAG: hypothetical protein FJX74_21370 [Armatimonadetes bacterium]|nr:hypothetical protein [Armatimonadota bacterium]
MASTSGVMATRRIECARPLAMETAERCVAFSRGVVLLTALAMLEGEVLLGNQPLTVLDAVVVVAALYVLGTTVLSVIGRERPGLQLPLLVADMLMITGIIYLAGGVYNEYYLLYYVPILQASVRLNFRDAIASAILSSGFYAIVGLSSGPDTLIPVKAQLRASTFAASATFMAAFFGLLSREARSHLQRSREMTELAGALSAKNRELEEKSRQLAQAQEHLVASERLAAIGELAGSVGHELRNPLGVIRNAAYYLRKRLDDASDDVREMVDLMDGQVDVCDRTITALLDFARPEQAVIQPTDVQAVVEEALEASAAPAGVSVDLQLAADLPAAQADAHQLTEVLSNLIRNACQAMRNEGRITLRTERAADGGFLCIHVADSGPGISPEHLPRIFDPLFTTKAKGIGLGLVVCKRFVERQGGELSVRSEPGGGAVFTVRLPAVQAEVG